jgi:hypothetical protein
MIVDSLRALSKTPYFHEWASHIFLSSTLVLDFLNNVLNAWMVVLFGIDYGLSLPSLSACHGVYVSLHFIKILSVQVAFHDCLHKIFSLHVISDYKLFVQGSELDRSVRNYKRVTVNVVRNLHWFIRLDCFEDFFECFFITWNWRTICVNFYFPLLENVYSLLTWNLRYLFVGSEYLFMNFFGNFDVKIFCPVTHVKQARFQYSEWILSTNLFSQIVLQFC